MKSANATKAFANRNWFFNHPMHRELLISTCFYSKLLSWTLIEGEIASVRLLLRRKVAWEARLLIGIDTLALSRHLTMEISEICCNTNSNNTSVSREQEGTLAYTIHWQAFAEFRIDHVKVLIMDDHSHIEVAKRTKSNHWLWNLILWNTLTVWQHKVTSGVVFLVWLILTLCF